MVIKNFQNLSKKSGIRKDTLKIVKEGLVSISPSFVLKNKIRLANNILQITDKTFDLNKFNNIYVIGFGKASGSMASAVEKILGKQIKNGLVIDVSQIKLKRIKVKKGTHPLISRGNIQSSVRIINIVKQASDNDLVICLISGGGSALFEKPYNSFMNTLKINKRLLLCGASIHEINIIRKHISQVKGGGLTGFSKAKIISLIFSDVAGDNLDIIASGPTSIDKSTIDDAKKIIKKYKLPKTKFFETPKNKKIFTKVDNIILLNNQIALEAMKKVGEKLGYKTKIITSRLSGESKKVGEKLLQLSKKMKKKEIYLFGGETTVKVFGNGKGGRNTELALSFLKKLPKDVTFASIASDGADNTDSAGAIVDEETSRTIKKLNLNADDYLKNNDSYNLFQKTNDLIFTGLTGSNVADLIIMLKK